MRVLWFSVIEPNGYDSTNFHNGGGWISSLEDEFIKKKIDLGISFLTSKKIRNVSSSNVKYFPIIKDNSIFNKFIPKINLNSNLSYLKKCKEIIDSFKPDIIQVFGSEWFFARVTLYTKIPVIIHMQGSLPIYYISRFPPGYSKHDFIKNSFFNIKKIYSYFFNDYIFKIRSVNEELHLRINKYYFGRTNWDKKIVNLYNDNSKYFHCDEVLRKNFYLNKKNLRNFKSNKLKIVSTISNPFYKGFDLIIKTCKILDINCDFDYEWCVFGITNSHIHLKKLNYSNQNLKIKGIVSENELIKNLIGSDVYVHSSYIDNSPNSLCEAQILGLPIISTNVGGINSLINNYDDGILIPSNEPHMFAASLKEVFYNHNLYKKLSFNGRKRAKNRHDKNKILDSIYNAYLNILDEEGS